MHPLTPYIAIAAYALAGWILAKYLIWANTTWVQYREKKMLEARRRFRQYITSEEDGK